VAWRWFDVAAQYFEEILFDLKNKNKNKKQKELIRPIEWCASWVWYLPGVSVNVCRAAEAPDKKAGKWMASKSSLAKVL